MSKIAEKRPVYMCCVFHPWLDPSGYLDLSGDVEGVTSPGFYPRWVCSNLESGLQTHLANQKPPLELNKGIELT
jgi:hypothetical protein